MKKIITALLSILVILGATGCTENSNNNVTDIEGNEKTTFNINETAVFDNVHYTITNVEYSTGDEWDEPARR